MAVQLDLFLKREAPRNANTLAQQAAQLAKRLAAAEAQFWGLRPIEQNSMYGELSNIRNALRAIDALEPPDNLPTQWDARVYEYGDDVGTYAEQFVGSFHYYQEILLEPVAAQMFPSIEAARQAHRLAIRKMCAEVMDKLPRAPNQQILPFPSRSGDSFPPHIREEANERSAQ